MKWCCGHTKNLRFLLALFLAFILSACDSSTNTAAIDLNDRIDESQLPAHSLLLNDENALVFGFDLRASPQEDARQYLPFLQYLEQATGYKFKLHFTPKNISIVDELGTGHIHLAAIGADTYIHAHEKYGVVILVRGVNHKGKAEYQSTIVVQPNSQVNTIQDLKDKRFAFGNLTSTQGHLIPMIVLTENDLSLADLADYDYTGSHQNCVNAVVAGKFDACGMQDTMAHAWAEQGLVRIIHTSRYYPSSGIAINQDLPPEIINTIKQALLEFDPAGKHRAGLYNWHKTEMPNGFVAAKASDYTELRNWSIRLGLLKPVSATATSMGAK